MDRRIRRRMEGEMRGDERFSIRIEDDNPVYSRHGNLRPLFGYS
jgi:hypothetical protein